MSRMRSQRARGISLIEVLLGLFIFATAFLMLLGVFPTSVRSVHQGRFLTLGTHVAEQAMDQTLAQGFNGLRAGTTTSSVPLVTMVNGTTEVANFQVTVEVADEAADMKSVRTQVSWTEATASGTHVVRYVNLQTLVVDPT